ncbi:MAG TPA: ATP-binding cassette domain-containing protein [Clostridia bacterium]|nr:ATP-binding cassette domain-containing protein [Clostridia bacterium]
MISVDIYKKLKYFNLDISFRLNNEVLVIQGPSGSGKTTVLDCICGIREPDSGTIIINGNTVFSSAEKLNTPISSRNIGYVFQDYALFPHMTVKNNILFGMRSKGIKDTAYCERLMDTFKIKHLEHRHPSQISGGEKQRGALARALSVKPELLLMDEPFSALDSDTRQGMYSEFLEFKRTWNISILLITHSDEEAKLLGDRVIKLREGHEAGDTIYRRPQ